VKREQKAVGRGQRAERRLRAAYCLLPTAYYICIAWAALGWAWSPAARADVFLLAQGGRISGDLQNAEQSPRETYVIKTPDGTVVTLGRAQVKQVVRQRPQEVEYEKLRVRTAETVEAQWELAQWCKENKLTAQRNVHLRRVIALDPEHGEARQALGYQRKDGKWFTRDELMLKQGYVRYRGKWLTPEEVAQREEESGQSALEKEWTAKLATWQAWLRDNRAETARENIQKINDPAAVRALAAALNDTRKRNPPNAKARVLFIQVLGRLGTPEALGALAECSLYDEVEEVRLSCLDHLKKKKAPKVVEYYKSKFGLRSTDNVIINRAALGLKEMGDPSAIGPLIDHLITMHKTKLPGPPPGQMTPSFSKGPGGGGMSFGTGGGGPKTIVNPIKNLMVLDALVSLTGEDFQFNVDGWREWYLAQKKRESEAAGRGKG
jgi:hypothetical protein